MAPQSTIEVNLVQCLRGDYEVYLNFISIYFNSN